MIDEKFKRLIHREVDGVNHRYQSRKLKNYLESNSEAKQFYQDLISLSDNLSVVAEVEPPQNLKKNILNAIPPEKYTIKRKLPAFKLSLESILLNNKIRYAYVFAVGIIVGGFGIGLLFNSMYNEESAGISKLSGTMVKDRTDGSFRTIDNFDISGTDLTGHVELSASNGALLMNIQLNVENKVDVVLNFDGNAIHFMGIKDLKAAENNLVTDEKSLQFSCIGENSYFILWDQMNTQIPPLQFKLYSSGTLITDRKIKINPE